MKIAILGFGREGRSLLKFLKTSPIFEPAQIRVLDQKSDKHYLKNLAAFDLIFRSPGVPYNLPEIQKAVKNGIKLSSATKLFFDFCPVGMACLPVGMACLPVGRRQRMFIWQATSVNRLWIFCLNYQENLW